ncbi:MAG: hypothetical protein ING08_02795, partial [Roseomonas sp.]|nr:hypothetical protein [Roseomonas sp.]
SDAAAQRFLEDTGTIAGRMLRDEANAHVERETRRISWLLHDNGRSQRDPASVNLERLTS